MEVMDRRHEPRDWAAGLINWETKSDHELHWGLLSDDSQRSISFITKAAFEPLPGEHIQINRSNRAPQDYYVARVAPYDRTLSFVACTMKKLD
jgi:hypothetical protein